MIGLIADVHSNLPALKAVMAVMESSGINEVICAGDIVGYGPHPIEVIDIMRENNIASIAGNHDRAVAGGDTMNFNQMAVDVILWTRRQLSSAETQYLDSLNSSLYMSDIAVFHGHPSDPNRYIFPGEIESGCAEILELAGTGTVTLGHTHKPAVIKISRGLVVNPGAVGQPRDGDPRASFAIFNPDCGDAVIRRVSYPVKSIQKDIEEAGLPGRLARRLVEGT